MSNAILLQLCRTCPSWAAKDTGTTASLARVPAAGRISTVSECYDGNLISLTCQPVNSPYPHAIRMWCERRMESHLRDGIRMVSWCRPTGAPGLPLLHNSFFLRRSGALLTPTRFPPPDGSSEMLGCQHGPTCSRRKSGPRCAADGGDRDSCTRQAARR